MSACTSVPSTFGYRSSVEKRDTRCEEAFGISALIGLMHALKVDQQLDVNLQMRAA
jgi:hypothetical protein